MSTPSHLPHRATEQTLEDAFTWLQESHHKEFERPDALRCTEHILALSGTTSRELLRTLEDHERLKAEVEGRVIDPKAVEELVRTKAQRLLFHHYGYSTQETPLKSLQYRDLMVAQFLEWCVRDRQSPEGFRQLAMVMTDIDGLKAVKDAIGHDATNTFVSRLAGILGSAKTPTNARMREQGIEPTTIVAGGDELLVMMERRYSAIRGRDILATIEGLEADVTASEDLRAMINFDNPVVLRNYANRIGALEDVPDEKREEVLRRVRLVLPEIFVPSITGGGVKLTEGIAIAEEGIAEVPPMKSAGNFSEAASILARSMFVVAEDREHGRKLEFKKAVAEKDPRHAEFLTRARHIKEVLGNGNGENGDA